ncbi:hypothetical protein V1477_008698 [Vespula maculifrons]|uniref:Uncharacterized protein n=1 Tax=Vespula maculifrons TaxID=7453 RepID=A0ABD2CE68_VESMC
MVEILGGIRESIIAHERLRIGESMHPFSSLLLLSASRVLEGSRSCNLCEFAARNIGDSCRDYATTQIRRVVHPLSPSSVNEILQRWLLAESSRDQAQHAKLPALELKLIDPASPLTIIEKIADVGRTFPLTTPLPPPHYRHLLSVTLALGIRYFPITNVLRVTAISSNASINEITPSCKLPNENLISTYEIVRTSQEISKIH